MAKHSKPLYRALSTVLPRPSNIGDISDSCLQQLTTFLYKPADLDHGDPASITSWLESQRDDSKKLPASLRRPKGFLGRVSLSVCQHGLDSSAPRAPLCWAHEALDPRLIREILRFIQLECTERVVRYRKRMSDAVPAVRVWLNRLDGITTLWTGKKAVDRDFGCGISMPSERQECEACILAAIGGLPQIVCDILSSLITRHDGHEGHYTEPRLLRVMNAWTEGYDQPIRGDVYKEVDALKPMILAMRKEIRRDRRRKRKGKDRCEKSRAKSSTTTTDGQSRTTYENFSLPRTSQSATREDLSFGATTTSSHEDAVLNEPKTPPSGPYDAGPDARIHGWEQQYEDPHTWEDGTQLPGYDTFSDYAANSAVPPPLVFSRARTSWATQSVHSAPAGECSDDSDQAALLPQKKWEGLTIPKKPPPAPSSFYSAAGPPRKQDKSVDDLPAGAQGYRPARSGWKYQKMG